MLIYTLLSTALAAPPGFHVSETYEGCELSLGPADASGVIPMHAECHWPELSPATFKAAMSRFEDHAKVWSSVQSSTAVRTEGARTLARQVHLSKGISNREVMMWLEGVDVDGGWRFQWTKAAEPFTLTDGYVLPSKDDGFCQGTAHPDGGLSVVYQLSYDPGGSVPGFLVRWFQTSGLEAIVHELRVYLAAQG